MREIHSLEKFKFGIFIFYILINSLKRLNKSEERFILSLKSTQVTSDRILK